VHSKELLYLMLFYFIEMLDSSLTETQAFKDVVQSRNAGLQIDEIRKWDLYRAYPSIAQGNVSKT